MTDRAKRTSRKKSKPKAITNRLFAIWDCDKDDYLREYESKVNNGGVALLVFQTRKQATTRAEEHWGKTYDDILSGEWGRVVNITPNR